MIWNTLMTGLISHLTAELAPTPVQRGAHGQTPISQKVIIKRGASGPMTLAQVARTGTRLKQSGSTVIFIECWDHDKNDFEAADLRLSDLENKVVDAIPAFVQAQHQARRVFDLEMRLDPDGDLFRPSVASQFTLTFNWRGTQ